MVNSHWIHIRIFTSNSSHRITIVPSLPNSKERDASCGGDKSGQRRMTTTWQKGRGGSGGR
ncbi:hypothetical protein TSUD_38060 [Trifolium subterraneum]|uniref:Uncharacterized protein n=1 Tax=Trifolium subterraneum TaxID=3900 RepID=A0A2Z6NBV3_TRISU|nr:hypothetical protein TSUD_38060 [Trifolium subterraneum]